MNWPDDADGDVFRRLQSRGFDFSKRYAIDFQVEFDHWPPDERALSAVRELFPGAVALEPEDGDEGYVQFQVYDYLTYEAVIAIQAKVSKVLAEFGGQCNSWGVLH